MAVTLDTSIFFDGQPIYEKDWRKARFLGGWNGVVYGALNNLHPFGDSSGLQVKVDTGQVWVENAFGELAAQHALPVAADPSNPRVSLVVVRNVFGAAGPPATGGHLELDILNGTPAGSPVAPTLTQNSAMYEMAIASVAVGAAASTITAGNVTDLRAYTNKNTVRQVLLDSTSGGNLKSTSHAQMMATTATLPAGWLEMDLEIFGHADIQVLNQSDIRRATVQLESPLNTAIGEPHYVTFEDPVTTHTATGVFRNVSLSAYLEGLTGSTAIYMTGFIDQGTDNSMQYATRYCWCRKTRTR